MLRTLPLSYYLALIIALSAANYGLYEKMTMPPAVTVHVFAAGKGTAALVQTPGRTLLVDTGSDASILRSLGETLPYYERSIDAIVLTGDKAAQTGGLSFVQQRYRAARVFSVGPRETPYGAPFAFRETSLTIIKPGAFAVSRGASTLVVSSSTTPGTYRL